MLADIAIENLGVIPRASVELNEGLTVLTGETGAGKTMVVTGLRLLSGGRAEASRVRDGSERACVEGRFVLDGIEHSLEKSVVSLAESAGAQPDENGEFIANRVIAATGRSKAHLGGRSVPAATLADFSRDLLTIHGQNDQLRLLSPDRQREALDRYDPKIGVLKEQYAHAFNKWVTLKNELKAKSNSRRELAQEADRLDFAITEITAVSPMPAEDEELVMMIRRLQAVDDLRESAVSALFCLDGAGGLEDFSGGQEEQAAASDLLGQAYSSLAGSEDNELGSLAQRLAEAVSIVSEVSQEIGSYLSALPTDDGELDKFLNRQQDLKRLTRKYAADIDGVLEWLAKAQKRRAQIDISPEALESLKKEVAAAHDLMLKKAKSLSNARKKAAKKLTEEVTEEIHGLAMPKGIFEVNISPCEPMAEGIDAVEFRLAPNAAAVPRSLAQSASGGELSRVMLALEVILSSGVQGTTLVFDEVDAGVGGASAVEIGRRLARLALHNQVIVVTHLPQVAAFADTHLHVAKNVTDSTVSSGVQVLTEEERVQELARMLAGLGDTETGRAHARELLDMARSDIDQCREQHMGVAVLKKAS